MAQNDLVWKPGSRKTELWGKKSGRGSLDIPEYTFQDALPEKI